MSILCDPKVSCFIIFIFSISKVLKLSYSHVLSIFDGDELLHLLLFHVIHNSYDAIILVLLEIIQTAFIRSQEILFFRYQWLTE